MKCVTFFWKGVGESLKRFSDIGLPIKIVGFGQGAITTFLVEGVTSEETMLNQNKS